MKMRRFAMNYKKRKRMFEKYVEPFADDVFRIINNVFDDNELSNDLAQIVMEKAWNNIHTVRDINKIQKWVKGIVRNEIRMELRRRKSEYEVVSWEEHIESQNNSEESYMMIENDVLNRLERREEQIQIIKAIRKLSKTDQMIIRMHLMEDMTFREIGDIMGVKGDTVKHRFYRAMEKVKNIYDEMERGGECSVKSAW